MKNHRSKRGILLVSLVTILLLSGCQKAVSPKADGSAQTTNPEIYEVELPELDGIAYEPGSNGPVSVHVTGLDVDWLEWYEPSKGLEPQLYMANPRFLHPYFDDIWVEGGAAWENEDHTAIRWDFTQNSRYNDGGAIAGSTGSCIVDLENGGLLEKKIDLWKDEEIALTDDDLITCGLKLARILLDAELFYEQEIGSD